MKYNLTKIVLNTLICGAVIAGLVITKNPHCLWGLTFVLIVSQTYIE